MRAVNAMSSALKLCARRPMSSAATACSSAPSGSPSSSAHGPPDFRQPGVPGDAEAAGQPLVRGRLLVRLGQVALLQERHEQQPAGQQHGGLPLQACLRQVASQAQHPCRGLRPLAYVVRARDRVAVGGQHGRLDLPVPADAGQPDRVLRQRHPVRLRY
jgi:hypothetical protein